MTEYKYPKKLNTLLENFDPEKQIKVKKDIDTLLKNNVTSFEKTLFAVKDEGTDIEIRLIASWILGQLKNKRALDTLLETFKSTLNKNLIWEISKSLIALKSKKFFPDLFNIITNDKSNIRRMASIYCIGRLKDKEAMAILLRILSSKEEPPDIRSHAAESLGIIGNTKAVPCLIKALNDESAEVRFWSVYALGMIGNPVAVPVLEKLMNNDTGEVPGWGAIREEAKNAINQINEKEME